MWKGMLGIIIGDIFERFKYLYNIFTAFLMFLKISLHKKSSFFFLYSKLSQKGYILQV